MKKYSILLVALGIGIANAILLRIFEFLVNDGTDQIWNHLFKSDVYRWVVVPLAVVFSIALTYLIRRLHEKRVVPVDTDLMDEMGSGPATLSSIAVVLIIGLASLLAGASLGPEASLMTASGAFGVWAATKSKLNRATKLIVLASVGALLVAFLGSFIMVLVPLLLLYKQKQLKPMPVIIILLAGLTSIGTVHVIDPKHPGFGTAPPIPAHEGLHDFVVALVAGFITAILAFGMNRLVEKFAARAKDLDKRLSWPIAASVFGLGIGILYLLGGQSIEFSGSVGSHILVANSASYGIAAIFGLIIAKLLATTWSKASGYRGGLVFPSIYMGTAIGLLLGQLVASWAGAGAMVGGISGMLSSVTGSPIIAGVFVLAILPAKLLFVALVAIIGSSAGSTFIKRLTLKPSAKKALN